MDAHRLGAVLRAVRRRQGRRQADVARLAGVSDVTVSRIERGAIDALQIETVFKVARALDVRIEWLARWRGAELDRLVNARHSAMHDAVVPWLEAAGWQPIPEVSFSIYGERGVIDVLARHPGGSALVVELKSTLVDVQQLIGAVDRYARLAPRITRDRGWPVNSVGVWVLMADGRTNRRRVAAHARVLRAAFPADGRRMRAWLQEPSEPIRALSFLPDRLVGTVRSDRGGSSRVRVPRSSEGLAPDPANSSPGDGSAMYRAADRA